jgi:hypothetical protein
MYAVLMAAALAIGSGEGRTVEKVPPYKLLREGIGYGDLRNSWANRIR